MNAQGHLDNVSSEAKSEANLKSPMDSICFYKEDIHIL